MARLDPAAGTLWRRPPARVPGASVPGGPVSPPAAGPRSPFGSRAARYVERVAARKRRSRSPGGARSVGAPRRLLAAPHGLRSARIQRARGPAAKAACGETGPPSARPGRLRSGLEHPGLARRRLPQPPTVATEAASRRCAPGRDGEHAPAPPPGSSGRSTPFAVAPREPRARRCHGRDVAARTRAGGRGPGATPRGAAAEGEPGAAGRLRPRGSRKAAAMRAADHERALDPDGDRFRGERPPEPLGSGAPTRRPRGG